MKSKRSLPIIVLCILFSAACHKNLDNEQDDMETKSGLPGHLKQAKTFTSEVATKWIDMQLRVTQVPPGTPGTNYSRMLAYTGVALYEAVVAGMPSHQSLASQLNGLPQLPKTSPGYAYNWAVCANAAMAYMSKHLLPAASPANVDRMDSLENALNEAYKPGTEAETFDRSVAYGKSVAEIVFNWSLSDGALDARPPYVAPVGTGLWASTPPNFPAATNPYGGLFRPLVAGSGEGSAPTPPPAYSTTPGSPYYEMVKEVYDVNQSLTQEQKDIAAYYRDVPGYPGGGHYLSIITQVLKTANANLETAALTYAKCGIAMEDAIIECFKVKYSYNLERPVQYISTVLGHPGWLPYIVTPGHPEFPSAHSNQGGAVATMLATIFGDKFELTNHTYDYLGLAPRTYHSFSAMVDEIGISRVYGGIHYRASCEKGKAQGAIIANNILKKVKF